MSGDNIKIYDRCIYTMTVYYVGKSVQIPLAVSNGCSPAFPLLNVVLLPALAEWHLRSSSFPGAAQWSSGRVRATLDKLWAVSPTMVAGGRCQHSIYEKHEGMRHNKYVVWYRTTASKIRLCLKYWLLSIFTNCCCSSAELLPLVLWAFVTSLSGQKFNEKLLGMIKAWCFRSAMWGIWPITCD